MADRKASLIAGEKIHSRHGSIVSSSSSMASLHTARAPSFASLPEESDVGQDRVLSLIERLHELSASEISCGPKIVVVGSQTSGKSSLLEGLTGLAFPVSHQLCTRFATQVILRHAPDEFPHVKAFVVPGGRRSMEVSAGGVLIASTAFLSKDAFDGEGFAEIVFKATKQMGILDSGSYRRFSDSILKIEISGPEYQPLCVVDLPGFCLNPTIYQTNDDLHMIKEVISSYVDDPHNIILAVIEATSKFSNQEAFQIAKTADPEGVRTVGVITKCDAIQSGDEDEVMSLARNEVEYLPHGWCVVRNRSTQEVQDRVTLQQRDINEQGFFSQSPWNELEEQFVGIKSLRDFLQDLVNNHTKKDLLGLVQEIQDLADEAEDALEEVLDHDEKMQHSNAASSNSADKGKERQVDTEETEPIPWHTSNPAWAITNDPDLEMGDIQKRPIMLLSACMVACTVALVLTLMGLGARQLAQEVAIDGNYTRLALIIVCPLQIYITLFFAQALVGNLTQMLGPVSQMKKNSKFYSAIPPVRLNRKHGFLPHLTVQCPVYKEGLYTVIEPTILSLKAAIYTYEEQGGTASIFINDDGMQLISDADAEERKRFYAEHDVGWVARPKHNADPDTEKGEKRFLRKGKFKKASNMNYALSITNRVEEKLLEVDRPPGWSAYDEENAYQDCLEAVLHEDDGRTWASGNIRVGDYILLIDSDTRVPIDCLIDPISEMEQCPRVAILQFSSGVMNVTTSFFEKGITFFTNLIYSAIRFAVAAGDVSAFVGHNAFLRWSALQEVAFYDEENGYECFWSEAHVSEDFDMALRLQTTGYIVRLAAYANDGFKEGVSLTVYDELARWEKYAYGCNEMIFHPMKDWPRRGPFTPLIKTFWMSSMPIGSKITIQAYIGTYYALGYAWVSTLMNYFLVGWLNGYLDHFYVDSFQIYFAIIVVFTAMGNVSLGVMRYRVENRSLLGSLFENFKWVLLLVIFLGGVSLHISQALLCHLFSIDMSWGATSKESEDTTFFIELPRVFSRFKYTLLFCFSCTALMICGAVAFPVFWRIDFFTAIWPLVMVVVSHFFLPVLLNPALMKFTW